MAAALIALMTAAFTACAKPSVETVVVSAAGGATSMQAGETLRFSAVVTGKNNPSQSVTWSVSSTSDGSGTVANGTDISPGGSLTVSDNETVYTLYVRAASTQSADKFDYAQIKINTVTAAPATQPAATAPAAPVATTQPTAIVPAATTQPAATAPAATTQPAATAPATPAPAVTQPTTPPLETTTPATTQQPATPAITQPPPDYLYYDGTVLTRYTGAASNLVIPEGITAISYQAFIQNPYVRSVTMPSSVTVIEEMAFYHCTGLTSITIPASVTSIDREAFYLWERTQTVNIPFANKEAMDAAWGTAWSQASRAQIRYQ